ncbi:O-antigen ligase family protein [Brevibacillus fulvus]|uniref:O-antigen ligase n=1 Tax=Brevibacillus fulvus TaxID=1125967 RepID=A0A939BUY8_9BACL|nr:O-antigen ligase family protein [Brevibacillus fulvus]MBM7590101.1 O-antigen ligase [Brevibacillus fulvus]
MRQALLKWGTLPNTWLYLLLAYPIIDYIMRKILPIPIVSSFWDDGLILVLLVFALIGFLQGERKMPAIKHLLIAFLMYGLGLMMVDMVNLDASIEGFRSIYQYMLAFVIGFYLFQSKEQLTNMIRLLGVVGFIVGLIGVMQVVLGVETSLAWVNAGESTRTRAFSIVTSPNVLGSYMAFITPVAMGLFLYTKQKKEKIWWLLVSLTTLAALLFTASRGAWFAFAFVIFIGCWIWNRRLAIYLLILGIIGAVVLYYVPNLPLIGTVKDRLATLFTVEYFQKSLQDGRLARWYEAYNKMRVDPLFGVGMGHHGGAVASRHFGTIYSDSYLFKSIAELGLLGVGLLISLIVLIIRYCFQVTTRMMKTPSFYILLGISCGMLAVSLHNMVENIFEVPFMSLYFWLFGGFFCALHTRGDEENRRVDER